LLEYREGKKGKKLPKDPTADKPIEVLYRQLVFDGIVQKVDKVKIADFEGAYLYLGAAMDKLANEDKKRLPDPSAQQVRAAVTEFGVLPLGSQAVKDHAPLNMTLDPKTGNPKGKPKPTTPLLIVGAPGTGKRLLVNAIANETGANLFNLTPSNTDGKYSKKEYVLVHTTFKVAKALAPSVVWIGDVDSVFKSGKVKGATGEPPNRIMKHLTATLNPKKGSGLIEPEDRVLLVGTSTEPYNTDKPKDKTAFRDFFAKIVYAPLPNYPSRQMLWTSMLEKKGVFRPNPDDVQTIARISDRYSSGAITKVVDRTLTTRRVDRLPRKPFDVRTELIGPLAKDQPVESEKVDALTKWYQETVPFCKTEGDDAPAPKKDKGGKKKK